jgi:MFS family permease
MAFFYLASAASGAFSGLLAAGIAQMDGVGGYEGWRWICTSLKPARASSLLLTHLIVLLEGIMSVVIGVMCFFALPDSPSTARWLKPDEAKFLELSHIVSRGIRIAKDSEEGGKKKRVNWPIIKQVLGDQQLYLQSLVFWSNTIPNYGKEAEFSDSSPPNESAVPANTCRTQASNSRCRPSSAAWASAPRKRSS